MAIQKQSKLKVALLLRLACKQASFQSKSLRLLWANAHNNLNDLLYALLEEQLKSYLKIVSPCVTVIAQGKEK
jgi:hypothetical protein